MRGAKAQAVPTHDRKDEEWAWRIVVDEVLGGMSRVLISKMKTTATEDQSTNPVVWEVEEEQALNERQLQVLLSDQDIKKLREGHVFKARHDRISGVPKPIAVFSGQILEYSGIWLRYTPP